ncbi:MAG: protocatechuate 3,4-dioxygenase subunit alpha [Pseudomonadota bacterium]|jgi:protocatechuate 3,4-dioxygenase alpha subunit
MTHVLAQTPSQTVGPYFAYGLTPQQYGYDHHSLFTPVLAGPRAQGQAIEITGQVFDGNGRVVNDAMIEIAHANAQGQAVATYAQSKAGDFTGYGRCGTGVEAERHFLFRTIKPGACAPGEAPYVNLIVFMRGLPVHAFTRIYFEDEASNAEDTVLQSVPADRRATLIAKKEDVNGVFRYRFDVHMQGPQETAFFDL